MVGFGRAAADGTASAGKTGTGCAVQSISMRWELYRHLNGLDCEVDGAGFCAEAVPSIAAFALSIA
jgi:hypothetical protein